MNSSQTATLFISKTILLEVCGVMLAINNIIPSKLLDSPDNLEILSVSLLGNKSFPIYLIYIPPNAEASQGCRKQFLVVRPISHRTMYIENLG